jgi:hypothetical protein
MKCLAVNGRSTTTVKIIRHTKTKLMSTLVFEHMWINFIKKNLTI